jgi:hypothetical protein
MIDTIVSATAQDPQVSRSTSSASTVSQRSITCVRA